MRTALSSLSDALRRSNWVEKSRASISGRDSATLTTKMKTVSTAATPKIADYPFTTLEPNLGVMDLGDAADRRPTVADVPGLIEGASSGAVLDHIGHHIHGEIAWAEHDSGGSRNTRAVRPVA